MTNSRTTRKALLSSALALLMCVAMLIATTFAWFTDTASMSVNKIQAGTLDVKLYYEDTEADQGGNKWKALEDNSAPLGWVQATNADGATKIISEEGRPLWEPGCTFSLPRLKIVNEGNLDLKYKIIISGIQGNAELNDVVTWTMKLDGTNETLGSEHYLYATADQESGKKEENIFTISGHMDENAGNAYQGKSIDGISITVVATQLNSEFDSGSNAYDALAQYPVYTVANVETQTNTTGATVVKTATTIESAEKISVNGENVSVATATVPAGVVLEDGATQVKLVIEDSKDTNNITITSNQAKKTLEVKLEGVDNTNNTEPATVSYYIESGLTGLKLYHNTTQMTAVASERAVLSDQQYYYDSATGKITMKSAKFSPFTYVYDVVATSAELAAVTDDSAKTVTISSAKLLAAFAQSVNNGKSYEGYTITLTQNIDLTGRTWTPIGNGTRSSASFSGSSFAGTFDGNKKTISSVNNSLFGIVTGTVKNVKIEASINNPSSDSVGAVAGILKGGKISEVEVSGSVIAKEATGGIVGRVLAEGTVEDCTNTATVESTNDGEAAGGIVGKAYYTIAGREMNIISCNNTGTIKGKYAAGGIAGFSAANVKNCENSGEIEMAGNSANMVGGIIGEQTNYGTISDNKNTVDITADGSVGGIIGWIRYQKNSTAYANNMTIVVSGNENSGNISGTGLGTGGIVGLAYNQAKVTGNKNTATQISGGTFAAGIVGGLQFNDGNLDMNESVRFIVTGNTSTTASDNISGKCKHSFAYDNTSSADISDNKTE